MDHVVHRHREGGGVAQLDHAQGVANQDHLDAGALLILRGQIVVRGQVDDLLALCDHLFEIGNGFSLSHVCLPLSNKKILLPFQVLLQGRCHKIASALIFSQKQVY